MQVNLILRCENRLARKARYVLSTFCKVLGLDLVEWAEVGGSLTPLAGPIVWYGTVAERPPAVPGLVCIYASPAAAAFYEAFRPRSAQDVAVAAWQGRHLPLLFAREPEGPRNDWLASLLNTRADVVHMPYDFIASAFYFLSRWEELVITDRDRHGRFPFARSLAGQLGLTENVVDLYLDLFITLLNLVGDGRWPQIEIPTWAEDVPFVVCLTHDVDEIRKSRLSRLKFVWDHLSHPEAGHRRTPIRERARFALSTLFSREDPYWTFPELAELERQFSFTASYYFQAGGRAGGSRYALTETRVRRFIDDLLEDGFEVGLHGTYWAAFDPGRFLQEKRALAAVAHEDPIGHRQHYLRMDYAATLPIYERAGLKYDTTLAYAEQEGYRNQFSYPYYPYNHHAGRPYSFLELPTVLMDATLGGYRQLTAGQAWQVIEGWLERTLIRRGCITLLWHNPWDGVFPGYFDLYPRILAWIRDHGGIGISGRDVLRQWQAR